MKNGSNLSLASHVVLSSIENKQKALIWIELSKSFEGRIEYYPSWSFSLCMMS